MLRAIGRALRYLLREAFEGMTNLGVAWLHAIGRVVYTWFRGDREISDAVALLVGSGSLLLLLVFLILLAAFIIGVFSWLGETSPNIAGPDDSPDSGTSDPEDRPWWE